MARKAALLNAKTQIRLGSISNTLLEDASITLGKLVDGADLLKRDGSVAMTADFNMGGFKVYNAVDATASSGLVTKAQLDAVSAGLDPKESVELATGADVVLATAALETLDGVALQEGQRVLVRAQTDATENGIYTAHAVGGWVRAEDHDGTPASEVSGGNFVFVVSGSTFGGTGWILIHAGTVDLGTDDINFTQFSAGGVITASGGLTKSGNDISLDLGNGIYLVGNDVSVKSEDSTIVVGALGVKVGTITDANIADASLALAKISGSEDVLLRDGSVAWTGNNAAGGFKLTGLANGTNADDAVNFSQLDAKLDSSNLEDAAATPFASPSDTKTATTTAIEARIQAVIPKWVHDEEVVGDDSTTVFSLTAAPSPVNAISVVKNGQVLTNTVDYSVSGNQISFTAAPLTTDDVASTYRTQ